MPRQRKPADPTKPYLTYNFYVPNTAEYAELNRILQSGEYPGGFRSLSKFIRELMMDALGLRRPRPWMQHLATAPPIQSGPGHGGSHSMATAGQPGGAVGTGTDAGSPSPPSERTLHPDLQRKLQLGLANLAKISQKEG